VSGPEIAQAMLERFGFVVIWNHRGANPHIRPGAVLTEQPVVACFGDRHETFSATLVCDGMATHAEAEQQYELTQQMGIRGLPFRTVAMFYEFWKVRAE
jgi:hypothetical protein